MSRERRAHPAVRACALPLILLVFTSVPSPADAQSLNCYRIRPGESAAQLSRRLTGDSANIYQPWFELVDASSRVVPKSQYDRIEFDWRACLPAQPGDDRGSTRQPDALVASNQRAPEPRVQVAAARIDLVKAEDFALLWLGNARDVFSRAGIDPGKVWIGAMVLLALVGWKVADGYVSRRRTLMIVMGHFAHRFVREFERPLIQQPTEPPLRSHLRLKPARGRLEIRLAPGPGRRYPNLSDHKKNVEYDIARVLRSVSDASFVPDRIYAQAGWVVVPFRFDANRKPTGVPCISSF